MPQIKCTVADCHYNVGVTCQAPMIQVAPMGSDAARNSDNTRCDTYKSRR